MLDWDKIVCVCLKCLWLILCFLPEFAEICDKNMLTSFWWFPDELLTVSSEERRAAEPYGNAISPSLPVGGATGRQAPRIRLVNLTMYEATQMSSLTVFKASHQIPVYIQLTYYCTYASCY